jgi:Dolichyl-phosphate-mannose-protein mannosyltransferase
LNTSQPSWVEAALLLVLMAVLAGSAAHRESVTFDEIAHIGAGASYLQKFDMRMNEEHPPLAKVLAALPLVLRRSHADYTDVSWPFSEKLFHEYLGEWAFGYSFLLHWNDPFSTLWWARVPMLLITLLLGLVLYYFGSQLGGSAWGGILCLIAFVSMPVFLAFGPLVITDIAVTLFWVLATWQLPRMWGTANRGEILKLGLALAGAFLSKFSSGLMFFVFPAVALSLRLWPLPGQPTEKFDVRAWRRLAWRNIAKAILWAAFFVYLFYLVLSWNESTDSFSLIPHFPASHLLRRILMPMWLYLRGLVIFAFSAGTRPTFILGHAYPHGVWFYFPVLFFLKSPLAFLLLLLTAANTALVIKARATQKTSIIPVGMELHWRCLWVSLTIYTLACLLSRLDISIRHFTIPLALIVLLLAPLPRMLEILRNVHRRAARFATWATFACAAAAVLTTIAAYPYYFPFVNSLSMQRPRYLLVGDSNVDWNQSLWEVKRFATQRGLDRILLDEYGFVDPHTYVPQAQLWDCQQPSPADGGQWAVVSANLIADGSNCAWLLQHLNLELAGGSMYAVLLPKNIPSAGTPGGPPLPQDYRYFGGTKVLDEDVRQLFLRFVLDPNQLQPTMDRFQAEMNKQRKNTQVGK